MKTVELCLLLVTIYLCVFYIWGRTFLELIRGIADISGSISFGFVVMHVVYQIFYIPFFLSRGSFRTLSMVWVFVSLVITLFCLGFIIKTRKRGKTRSLSTRLICFAVLVVVLTTGLSLLVWLHPRDYHDDGFFYIDQMNKMVYHDVIWHFNGALDYRHGFNSFFSLFATPCLFIDITPFYMSVFLMRFLGVILTSMVVYQTGKTFYDRGRRGLSEFGLMLSTIVPLAMMFWTSMYIAHFFWLRTNEAKAYCSLFLLPLAFSVMVGMNFIEADRSVLWKKQLAIGLSAIPIASSSMLAYPVLIIVGTVALLANDRFRNAKRTFLSALMCVVPNVVYIIIIIMQ